MNVQKRRYCAFEGTGLDLVLRSKGIRTVVVTGMATDICVEGPVLAVSTGRRLSSLPDVPTLAESGLKGFDIAAWYGVLGLAGLPQAVLQRANQDFIKAVISIDLQAALEGPVHPS